jgi:hypothetical protein
MRGSIFLLGLGLGTVASCALANAFECTGDDQCIFEGVPGHCEATGYCSFPDDDCESGWSYGQHAGAGLDGECVPVEGGGGDTSGDDGSGDDGTGDDGVPDDGGTTGGDDGGTSGTDTGTGTPDDCGNGTIDPDEDCDGEELGSATCASVGAGNEGELACTDDCEFDTSHCVDTCGLDAYGWEFFPCPDDWTHEAVAGGTPSSWECGTPVGGPGDDPEHRGIWATDLAGFYNTSESSALVSPGIDLTACPGESLWLSFEHWSDFSRVGSDIDGGIVQLSSDGGNTWDTVDPVRNGYGNQALSTTYSPPDGELGFTGDSDWVVSAVDLSSYGNEPDLAVRFVFGSSPDYEDPGWYIDWVALSKCGEGNVTADEQCEGLDLQGATCESLGFDEGTLACDPSTCFFDTSGCQTCGDGVKGGSEECDDQDFGGATCDSEGAGQYGSLACTADCQIDTSGCSDCTAVQTWDFSSCNQGWTTRRAYASASGSVSWDCGEPTSGPGTADGHDGQWATDLTGNYNGYESSALESPIIDLSQCNATSIRFVWEHWWAFEGSSSNYDGGILQVSTNGGSTWSYATPDVGGYFMGSLISASYPPVDNEYGYSGAPGATEQEWTTSELDLTSYLGQDDVMVRFVLGTDPLTTDYGWYIDWVEVRAQ